jgi:hypothetical protein
VSGGADRGRRIEWKRGQVSFRSFDSRIDSLDLLFLETTLENILSGNIPSGGVGAAILGLIGRDTIILMGTCHYRSSYLYGLLVVEDFYGTVVLDVLGYSDAELEAGRAP